MLSGRKADSYQIVYGQSLGGAVTIDLASRNPLAVRVEFSVPDTTASDFMLVDSSTNIREYFLVSSAPSANHSSNTGTVHLPVPPEVGLRVQAATYPSGNAHTHAQRCVGQSCAR